GERALLPPEHDDGPGRREEDHAQPGGCPQGRGSLKPITVEELRRCTEVLEALVDDRTVLADLSREERGALLQAAGKLSRPTRHEVSRFSKAFRKIERKKNLVADRQAREDTEIRASRRADVFSPPPALPGGDERELNVARACYVCKAEFKKLHF